MQVKLLFAEIEGNHVPYLWNDETGANHMADESTKILNMFEFELMRDVGASNRSRRITVIEGRQAAMSIAMLDQERENGLSIITNIGGDSWAVGTIVRDGSYDSGVPQVIDARTYGEPLEIEVEADILEEMYVTTLSAERPSFIEIAAQPDQSPEPR